MENLQTFHFYYVFATWPFYLELVFYKAYSSIRIRSYRVPRYFENDVVIPCLLVEIAHSHRYLHKFCIYVLLPNDGLGNPSRY